MLGGRIRFISARNNVRAGSGYPKPHASTKFWVSRWIVLAPGLKHTCDAEVMLRS
jgi:hypothetical protein